MTIDEIVARATEKPLTPERLAKLRALCQRMNVPYDAVMAQIKEREAKQES